VPTDRGLDDEALLASGCGWCNEQARAFVRLCQICGMPGRVIHLWGQNHTIAEFYADGRWALADGTYQFVVPGKDGKLLSVAQCHDGAEGQRAYAQAKYRRVQQMLAMSDAELGFTKADEAAKWRESMAPLSVEELAGRKVGFGAVNYPLPR
jgi:transglutaminase-like putative cysteine protease